MLKFESLILAALLAGLTACSSSESAPPTAPPPAPDGPTLALSVPTLPLEAPVLAARWSDMRSPAFCILSTEGWLECTGLEGADLPPEGQFVDLAAGDSYHCALDPHGRAHCWGGSRLLPEPPAETFVDLVASQGYGCGLRPTGSVLCWGRPIVEEPFKGGVAQLVDPFMGLDEEGRILTTGREIVEPPAGVFDDVVVRGGKGGGLRPDGSLVLWGANIRVDKEHAGPWKHVVLGRGDLDLGIDKPCAIDADGAVQCLSAEGWTSLEVPGKAVGMSSAGSDFCVLTDDGKVSCYGRRLAPLGPPVPETVVSSRPDDPARTAAASAEQPTGESHRVSCLRYMGCVCALGLTEACADVQRLLDLGDPPTSCDASLADIQLGIVESGAADLPLACRQKP